MSWSIINLSFEYQSSSEGRDAVETVELTGDVEYFEKSVRGGRTYGYDPKEEECYNAVLVLDGDIMVELFGLNSVEVEKIEKAISAAVPGEEVFMCGNDSKDRYGRALRITHGGNVRRFGNEWLLG